MRALLLLLFTLIGMSAAHAVTLDLYLGADLYQGPPHFQAIADGKVVIEGDVGEAKGEHFQVKLPTAPKTLSIGFTNDAAAPDSRPGNKKDRNLVVKSVTLDGHTWSGAELRPRRHCEVRGTDYVMCVNARIVVPLSGRQ